jgi:hypothetical protein
MDLVRKAGRCGNDHPGGAGEDGTIIASEQRER